jgi:hypothetical protein
MGESTFSQTPVESGAQDLPRVTVPLLGVTRDVQGLNLPNELHSERVGGAHLLTPHTLVIRIANGRELRIPVRSMSLSSLDGAIVSIYARRPINPASFKETVADLRRTMKSLGIEPDEKMEKRLASWEKHDHPGAEAGGTPDFVLYKAGTSIEPEIGYFHVHIKPDLDRGWYYLMNFGGSVEASQAAQAAAKAKPPPPEQASTSDGLTPTIVNSPNFSTVAVELGGPVSDIRGLDLQGNESASEVKHPHALTIKLSGERQPLFMLARSSSFSFQGGRLIRVMVQRPMLPLPYDKAISDLLNTMKALHADQGEIGKCFPKVVNGPERRELAVDVPSVFSGVGLRLIMKPEPENTWSYAIELIVNK